MLADQGTIRAIRVICGENSSEDWPQRGTEVTKRRRHFEPLIDADLEPRTSAHGKHGIHGRLSRKIGHKKHENAGRGSALTFVVKAADPLLGLLFGRWDTRERG